jgi:hypothetical protein
MFVEENSGNECLTDLKTYYRCQKDICFSSKLYGNKIEEHGSKVLMLFAELYAFMVDNYGIKSVPNSLTNFQNSTIFEHWFWRVKHFLGEEILNDPTFYDIGRWIGKGLFLKMSLSLTYHDQFLQLNENIMRNLIDRQKKLVKELLSENYFLKNGKKAIEIIDNGYILLKEKTILSLDSEYFYKENIIK